MQIQRRYLVQSQSARLKAQQNSYDTGVKLTKYTGDLFDDPTMYQRMIGSLQYVTITRPDLAYSMSKVSKLSQFMENPTKLHWQACKNILRFLKGTKSYGLLFTPGDTSELVAYFDADWGCDPDDRKSMGGFCVYLGGNLISWSSKKQFVVARSNIESEYRSLVATSVEITWLLSLLQDLKL